MTSIMIITPSKDTDYRYSYRNLLLKPSLVTLLTPTSSIEPSFMYLAP